jgi:hypothetical protein
MTEVKLRVCFARDLNRTPHDLKSQVLPFVPACSVMCLVIVESTSYAFIIENFCYSLNTFHCICTVVTVLHGVHPLVHKWTSREQADTHSTVLVSQCCLTWKNPGCHWALILPYVNLNGFLFMAVLHWILLVFRFQFHLRLISMYHFLYQSPIMDMLVMHSLLLTCPVVNWEGITEMSSWKFRSYKV